MNTEEVVEMESYNLLRASLRGIGLPVASGGNATLDGAVHRRAQCELKL